VQHLIRPGDLVEQLPRKAVERKNTALMEAGQTRFCF
jgi:hypothetical protein